MATLASTPPTFAPNPQAALAAALRLRPRTIGSILDTAVALYRQNFVTYVGIVALMQVPVSLILTLAGIALLPPDVLTPPRQPSFAASPDVLAAYQQATAAWFSNILSRLLISLVLGVAGRVLLSIATGALAQVIAANYAGRSLSLAEAYRATRPYIGALAGSILILIVTSLLAFIPPLFIWIFICWSFVTQVIVLERQSLGAALSRSWELVRGSWWRVFGMYLLLLLISIVLALPASAAPSLLALAGASWVVQNISAQFLSLLVTVVYLPVQLAGMTLLYFDLRVRKEGFDLQSALDLRAAQVGLEPAPPTGGWPYRPQAAPPTLPAAPPDSLIESPAPEQPTSEEPPL